MPEQVLDLLDICERLGISALRLNLVVAEGGLPKPRLIEGKPGWSWDEVQRSSFVAEPEKWIVTIPAGPRDPIVYYVATGDFVKIGFTTNLDQRLADIATHNPHPIEVLHTESGSRPWETWRHQDMEEHRYRGEWFHRKPVEEFLERLRNYDAKNTPTIRRIR